MKRTAIAVLLGAAVALGGCASTGSQALAGADQASVDQHIVRGKTTKADVVAYLGNPNSVTTVDASSQSWMYIYASARAKGATFIPVVGLFAGGMNSDSKVLMITFDQAGVVKTYTFSASTSDLRNGMATASAPPN